jgi:hypothetical protein
VDDGREGGCVVPLGIQTDVAVAWQRLSAGNWATYAAEVASRKRP